MHDVEPIERSVIEHHYWQFCKGGGALNIICCVLADIYTHTDDERLKLQCRRATAMAKAMSRKLSHYKSGKK